MTRVEIPALARPWTWPGAIPLASVGLGFLAGALVLKALGASPLQAYKAMLIGGWASKTGLAETLVKATPLCLAGTGLCIAFRSKFWNIGAEGQICAGTVAFTWLALLLPDLHRALTLGICLAGAAAAGAVWAAAAGALRALRGTNEIITTIMLNYVALYGVSLLIHGPMKDPAGYLPVSAEIPVQAHLPLLWPGTRLHLGLLVGLALMLLTGIVLARTTLGFALDAVGANPHAASYAGISVPRSLFLAALVSGGLAGIAGGCEVAGIHFKLVENPSAGAGFMAIAVALLGQNRPVWAGLAAVLLASLQVGADQMQREMHLPSSVVLFVEGLIVLFVLAGEALRQVKVRGKISHPPGGSHG